MKESKYKIATVGIRCRSTCTLERISFPPHFPPKKRETTTTHLSVHPILLRLCQEHLRNLHEPPLVRHRRPRRLFVVYGEGRRVLEVLRRRGLEVSFLVVVERLHSCCVRDGRGEGKEGKKLRASVGEGKERTWGAPPSPPRAREKRGRSNSARRERRRSGPGYDAASTARCAIEIRSSVIVAVSSEFPRSIGARHWWETARGRGWMGWWCVLARGRSCRGGRRGWRVVRKGRRVSGKKRKRRERGDQGRRAAGRPLGEEKHECRFSKAVVRL